ncbi:MAG: hypothetical protein DRJ05_11395, partial [Bacteroidetes bacterium]
GQVVFEHVSNKNIYGFIDELANEKFIEINSVVKPYSREFIANKLVEAQSSVDKMSIRQKKELEFYLIGFKAEIDALPDYNPKWDFFKKNDKLATALNPFGIFYKDKLFTATVKPIWGINYFMNEDNTPIYHRWGGLEATGYIGKHWGMYASLRDNTESEILSAPEFFTQRGGGGNFKRNENGGVDFEEMRGGVVYSWNWGYFGLVKDHVNWGNNYNGANIFNDRPPSITQLKLQVKPAKWFELNYFHGWLVSMVVDSSSGYYYNINGNPFYRANYRPKYMAANMFTFFPWKDLSLSMGNSIVYSDMNVYPGYLIPIMFYKAIDHTVNSNIDNQNSQLFFDISSRQIKKLHLYASLFIDEFKVSRVTDSETSNFWSTKIGVKENNVLINNLSINVEYTRSLPITYQHRVPTLTFESNNYNFGHYMRDNSQEIFVSLEYKPIRGLHIKTYYILAQHGPDYPYTLDGTYDTHPFIESVDWQNQTISVKATYEVMNNAYVFAEFINSDISGDEEQVKKHTPEFFRGQQNTISAGFNFGF